MKRTEKEVVGLIPAGGTASRIAPLPCSKELYPLGFQTSGEGFPLRPKVASHYLLEKIKKAGVNKVYIVIRKGKWDIPSYFGDGSMLEMHLAYLIMEVPFGTPYTLDQAYPFVKDSTVVFGFGDIIFEPDDAYVHLLSHLYSSKADIVLGIFPANEPHKMDMVDVDKDGRVTLIEIKPRRTKLKNTWFIAAWTPVFSNFMHEYLSKLENVGRNIQSGNNELYVGDVIQAGIDHGLDVESIFFPDNSYIDIGTPENLKRAVRTLNNL